jgi:GNAT superfamily N-acetyltransferase
MIRPTTVTDRPTLIALADATGVFKPMEIVALGEVFDDYHTHNAELGHRSITLEEQGRIVGFAYFAPAAMTDRTWYLYWIAVEKSEQGRGLGRVLLDDAEREITRSDGRLLLIETSSLPHYEPTRRFYAKHGYDQATVLRDFYADGDDMVVFRKRLAR